MKLKINTAILILSILSLNILSCKKYLDEKALKSQMLPNTLNDLQALLDSRDVYSNAPALLELVADNYYVSTSTWETLLPPLPDNSLNYIWDQNAVPHNNSWVTVYQRPIYYANIVLDNLSSIDSKADQAGFNTIKGSALFYRAFSFYDLAQLYCRPYSNSADTDPGIVLRMTSNINESSIRASVRQSYDRIIADLKEAAELLPVHTTYPTRPTKGAAYGALARTYLSMRDYQNAGKYADLCIKQKDSLLDYNKLIPIGSPPIATFNPEVVYHSVVQAVPILSMSNAKIDSNLFLSYDVDDLRKIIFFQANTGPNTGTYSFQGSYDGSSGAGNIFNGITVGEMYLTRAECNARAGNITNALSDLNSVMKKRWNAANWKPITAVTVDEAKDIVLLERRKELVFRGLRWTDLRRLNLEGAEISLKRIIKGTTYTLSPNEKRWLMIIPFDVINRSGIDQNPR